MPDALDYLDAQIDAIRTQIFPALEAFDEKAVHQARVATRRLKAGLDLLAPVVGKAAKPLNKAGKTLRGRLGPLRDLDVMLEHVGGVKPLPGTADALEWLHGKLDRARTHARTHDAEHGKSPAKLLARFDAWPAVRAAVADAASHDALTPLLTDALHAGLAAVAAEADLVSGRARPTGDHGTADPQAVDVHAVRIRGKALRYAFELAQAHGLPVPDGVVKTFKAMQEHLGDWHDGVVLAETALEHVLDHELPLHKPEIAAAVLDLAKAFLRDGNKALDRFRAQWTREGERLNKLLSDAVPLTRPAATAEATTPDAAESADAPGPVEQGTIVTGGA